MSRASATLALPLAATSRELPLLGVIDTSVELECAPVKEPEARLEKLVMSDELAAEISRENERLETAEPEEILDWAAQRFGSRFTMATAFGPEGMVLIHMLAEVAPETPIFNLDTGYQFKETLELREEIKRRYGIAVEMKRPDTTVEEYERQHGGAVYRTNPDQCCFDRKV
jgi:phosphoadenosine phosphosulfate reductase